MKTITNAMVKAIHQGNVEAGWWDDARPDGTTIALIHSEITEAFEGYTSGQPDQHLPNFPNEVVELADTAIRIYDFFGWKGWDLELARAYAHEMDMMEDLSPTIEHNDMNKFYADMHKHVSHALEGVRKNQFEFTPNGRQFSVAALELAVVMDMVYFNSFWGRPIVEAIEAKRAYNAQRADHKRENRAKAGGKKF